jgi:hypothetical protein
VCCFERSICVQVDLLVVARRLRCLTFEFSGCRRQSAGTKGRRHNPSPSQPARR